MITHQRLKDLLNYDPETGEFTWLASRTGTARAGTIAGRVNHGYRRISIDGTKYLAHRLAWLHVHGAWPAGDIDHIDMNRSNNRIANLREATTSQNKGNSRAYSNNTSGVKGVCWNKNGRFWQAQIRFQGKKLHLGCFGDINDAAAAYEKAAAELFGEFGRAA